MNSITLTGRLSKDPAVKQIQSQKGPVAMAGFPLVVKRNHTNKVFVVMVSAYGSNAAFAEKYLKKGTKIMVTGELNITPVKDKETGKTAYFTEVIMENSEFCETREKGLGTPEHGGFEPLDPNENPFEIPPELEAEMPFR